MTQQYAYSTDDPATVAAYREVFAAQKAFVKALVAECAAMGSNAGPLLERGMWGHPDRIVGLALAETGDVPGDGWRIVRGRLEPRRGKAGETARQWLADRQPPDVRHTLVAYGLPRHATIPTTSGAFTLASPALFEHDGTLWACYDGKPGDGLGFPGDTDTPGCTWTPRPLSEYWAAREVVYDGGGQP